MLFSLVVLDIQTQSGSVFAIQGLSNQVLDMMLLHKAMFLKM